MITAPPAMKPDLFFHAANLLMLAAYSVRDVLWLRLLAVAASCVALPYYFLQPHTLWTPVMWCGVFISMNLFRSWNILRERRPVKLNAEEEKVRQLAFRELPPRKVLEVLSIASWVSAEPGEKLLEAGRVPEAIPLIVEGRVLAMRNGRILGELGQGNLVGSALILTGRSAELDAVAVGPVRMVRWRIETLEKYLAANPETRAVMQGYLAHDLAETVEGLIARSAVRTPNNDGQIAAGTLREYHDFHAGEND